MKYPVFLNKKDKIALVAPSFGCSFDPYLTRLNASIENLSEDFTVEEGPNIYKAEVIGRSNTKEKCGEEINHYFNDPDTKALLSVGGGEIMVEILPYVDFELIKKNPKWFMGYSDNTNLTYLLPTICDVASVYGPNAPTFGIKPYHQSLIDALNILTGKSTTVKSYGMWEKSENQKKASCNVEVYILLCQFETYTLFEYGQEHVHSAEVETGCRALRVTIYRRTDQGLCLNEERAYSFYC